MSAVSELLGRYTVTDGMVIGSWLGWVALRFRTVANLHWKAGRHRGANLGRVLAIGLWGLAIVAFAVGWKLDPGGGPTVWSAVGLLSFGYAILQAGAAGRQQGGTLQKPADQTRYARDCAEIVGRFNLFLSILLVGVIPCFLAAALIFYLF